MEWLWLAVGSAFVIALAHHLGLVEKVSEVVGQICQCPRCSVFWGTSAVLLYYGIPLGNAMASALLLAYLTDWLGLLFNELAKLYAFLWRRQRRKRTRRSP